MLRRTTSCRISEYNFGHPRMTQFFGNIKMNSKLRNEDKGVKATTLPNGVRVVTHDKQGMQASVGFYADAGAKYDPITTPGLNYVLRWALLTSNMDQALFQIDRNFRSLGASYEHCEVRKRFLGWKSEGPRIIVNTAVNTLGNCIAAPRFPDPDVERFRDTMDNLLQENRWKTPHNYVVDQLETIAFWKEPLGNPRWVPPHINDSCNTKTLVEQWAALFIPSRVTLAGINVDHDTLISTYNGLDYPHSETAPHHARASKPTLGHVQERAQYRPGREGHEQEKRAYEMGTSPDDRADAIGAVGWLTNGRDNVKDYATSCVVRELLQQQIGAEAFKYDTHDEANGTRSFFRPFCSAGLMGFTVKS